MNPIKQRNDFVLKVIKKRKTTSRTLDIGCGTGDLVCEIASRGIAAAGVDFAPEMIRIAKEKAKKLGLKNTAFECCSIFDYHFNPNTYDAISANGFIEYISYRELQMLLARASGTLKRGGSLVLGSRNRLFNLFSLNKFTQQEISNGAVTALLSEAVQVVSSDGPGDLIGCKIVPLQPENCKHAKTDIEVSTRYQFTPSQLANMLNDNGFKPIEIYPIHIHGVTPKFSDKYPVVYVTISNLLQHYANNNCLIPQASSFMIHGKKR